MAFLEHKGKFHTEYWPKKASTAFTRGALVTKTSGAGTIEPAVAATTKVIGIVDKTIASTDTDYASTTLTPVRVPTSPDCEVEADVTGTLASTDPGTSFDLDATGLIVDKAATTTKILLCKRFISATKGIFSLAGYNGFNRD